MRYLVKFRKNWADEMDVYGVRILDDDGIAQLNEWIEKDGAFWFGTNEGWGRGEIDLNDFEIQPIFLFEEVIIEKFIPFRMHGYGNFPYIDEIYEDED